MKKIDTTKKARKCKKKRRKKSKEKISNRWETRNKERRHRGLTFRKKETKDKSKKNNSKEHQTPYTTNAATYFQDGTSCREGHTRGPWSVGSLPQMVHSGVISFFALSKI